MRRTMASSLGMMPTTWVRRLICETLDWVGRVQLGPMLLREGHVGEHVSLGFVEEAGKLGQLGAELIGDLAPLQSRSLGIVLGKGCGDEG